MADMKRNRVFRGFPVPFRMRSGRAGRGRPAGDRRPGRVEEAFRQSCAGADEGRSGPARLPRRRCGHHRRDGRAHGEDRAGTAGRLAGHQDAPGPGRARREPGRDGTRPRPEARTRDHPGPAAPPRRVPAPGSETSRPCGDAVTCGDAVKILSDGRYQSGPSHQLLPPLCGPSPEPPDPFDEHHDEPATTRRMAWTTTRVKSLSDQGRKAHTARLRPAPSTRPGPAGCSPPEDSAPERSVDRQRTSQSFSGAPPRPAEQSRRIRPRGTRTPGRRSSHRTGSNEKPRQRRSRSSRTTPAPHHAKALTGLHQPGQLLERITPVFLPPYAPDHNPAENVRNTARNNTANIQHETPEETLGASASHVTGHTVDHDSEHLPPRETRNDPVP